LALSLILLLGLDQLTQLLVPVRFQGVGHQAVLRVDLQESHPSVARGPEWSRSRDLN
jgi:hypothetical protein